MYRGTPRQRIHTESVVLTLSDNKLLLEILEGKVAVTTLYLAVVPWGVRADQLMPDP